MRYPIYALVALLLGAGCVSLQDADVRKNRITARTGMRNQEALEAAHNALRDAGFRISRRAEEMGLLRTEWTELVGYNAEMKIWVDVERGEIQLRGWYHKRGGKDRVVNSPVESELGKTAWQVMKQIAQRLPGAVSYEYGFD